MPKFLDAHKMGSLDEDALKKAQQSPPDESESRSTKTPR
jgi:hypothetical protein